MITKSHNHSHFWIQEGQLFESYETLRGTRYRHIRYTDLPDTDFCSDEMIEKMDTERSLNKFLTINEQGEVSVITTPCEESEITQESSLDKFRKQFGRNYALIVGGLGISSLEPTVIAFLAHAERQQRAEVIKRRDEENDENLDVFMKEYYQKPSEKFLEIKDFSPTKIKVFKYEERKPFYHHFNKKRKKNK